MLNKQLYSLLMLLTIKMKLKTKSLFEFIGDVPLQFFLHTTGTDVIVWHMQITYFYQEQFKCGKSG